MCSVLTAVGSHDLVREGSAVSMETNAVFTGGFYVFSGHFQCRIPIFAISVATSVCLSTNNSRMAKRIFVQFRTYTFYLLHYDSSYLTKETHTSVMSFCARLKAYSCTIHLTLLFTGWETVSNTGSDENGKHISCLIHFCHKFYGFRDN